MSVQVNDADSKKIQELFAKEHQCMTAQMQVHIRKVNSMFADDGRRIIKVGVNHFLLYHSLVLAIVQKS